MSHELRFIVLGLSITSSWGNGHATTYRSLLPALARRGHQVLFLERDMPWYASPRDLRTLPGVPIALYDSIGDLRSRFGHDLLHADVILLGSYVPEAKQIGAWLTRHARGVVAFYDIDTPITIAALEAHRPCAYVSRSLLQRYDLYLSFSGGPALRRLEALGARRARPLYCAVDPDQHLPVIQPARWDLGYLGTYADGRQPALRTFLLDQAAEGRGRFVVAGSLYPQGMSWPDAVDRIEHLPPTDHSAFYSAQRFTLNLTRADMRRLGYSPSVRLFEAASCGATIITDVWDGLSSFFVPFAEVLPAGSRDEVESYLRDLTDTARRRIGEQARQRILACHTADQRAHTLETYIRELRGGSTDERRTSFSATLTAAPDHRAQREPTAASD